jgi:hypothetical protein
MIDTTQPRLYRVRYLHLQGEIARTYPMSLASAKEIARQFITEGEREVLLEDQDGQTFSPDAV